MQITIDTQTPKRIYAALKGQVEANPLAALTVAGVLLGGAGNLMNANTKRVNAKTSRKNSKTWEREVARREKR